MSGLNMRLQDALTLIPGGKLVGEGSVLLQRVHTDTRTLQPGDLFVALKGERFDANEFLADAKAAGAVAAIAHGGLAAAGLHGIEVPDSKLALGSLATGWRARYTLPLIAVTGSNGKTTVTQMIASILRAWQPDAMLATQGNFNNDIGLPLTLMRLQASHRIGVVELGMNHPGEIALLAKIAQPTVALVNNAQREHQEFMTSVEAVARENGAIFKSLPEGGTGVFPAGDDYAPLWRGLCEGRRVMTFSDLASDKADVCGQGVWHDHRWLVRAQTPAGPLEFSVGIAGEHNVRNALAATTCALAAGVPLAAIRDGLQAFEPVKGRSRAFALEIAGKRITAVDDTYNANPDSVRAAIDVLEALPAPQLLVLGDMGEVGDQGPAFHEEIGLHAKKRGIAHVFTLGSQAALISRHAGGKHFGDDIDALNRSVIALLPGVGSVLVKGSRFMKMERVVEAITAHAGQPKPPAEKGQPHAA
ncbi:MAG: UDP-N-acetylmuramoyl-tripeptide--D-alanyl-D-alanine ligase [Burkholderiaceae bacterium]|nr:UDP-N-acetylmuramoyl-tripeptide--D-alanyl-D-alanine ligase [Burkholderiaceae bacterium]